MIKIYTSPSCSSCRKVKEWFYDQDIPFKEISIVKHQLTKRELREILSKTDNGIFEIVSKRSEVGKEYAKKFDDMKLDEILDLIIANPLVLKRPIIVGKRSLQVGYNSEEIERFLPKEKREKFIWDI